MKEMYIMCSWKRSFPGMSLIVLLMLAHQAEAQYPNIRVSSPGSSDPEEVCIAINPTNPLILAAGANIRYFYRSTDGGWNWMQSTLSSNLGVWGDPVVMFDGNGHLYYGHLSNPPSPGYWIDRIVVQKSTDGGVTWNNGTGIGFSPPRRNQDKEWLATDMTDSPYRNNIYMAWTEFDSYDSSNPADSSRILFSRTTDGGIVWSTPVRISDAGGNCIDSDSTVEGAVPAVGPEGEVYVAWAGPQGIMFDKSTDGGVTFGSDIFVTSQPGGWDFNVPGIYRCNGLPITACDVSSSPYRGHIYINWSDQRNGITDTDVYLIKSTNGGETWSPVKRVNNDITVAQQFFNWMTIDQTTGFLYVVFYDRRETAGNATDVYVARSTNGGETFTNFKVSQSSFTPSSFVFFGDYTGIAAADRKVYPIWMRMDGTALSVWTALITDSLNVIRQYPVRGGWNLISVPLVLEDNSLPAAYPTATGGAYMYSPHAGYSLTSQVENGKGYWVKFDTDQMVGLAGQLRTTDTVQVEPGWNLIGSISEPIDVSGIVETPAGIVVSPYYHFSGTGYLQSGTLEPGVGYWVKVSTAGTLLLNLSSPDPELRTLPKVPGPRMTVWH